MTTFKNKHCGCNSFEKYVVAICNVNASMKPFIDTATPLHVTTSDRNPYRHVCRKRTGNVGWVGRAVVVGLVGQRVVGTGARKNAGHSPLSNASATVRRAAVRWRPAWSCRPTAVRCHSTGSSPDPWILPSGTAEAAEFSIKLRASSSRPRGIGYWYRNVKRETAVTRDFFSRGLTDVDVAATINDNKSWWKKNRLTALTTVGRRQRAVSRTDGFSSFSGVETWMRPTKTDSYCECDARRIVRVQPVESVLWNCYTVYVHDRAYAWVCVCVRRHYSNIGPLLSSPRTRNGIAAVVLPHATATATATASPSSMSAAPTRHISSRRHSAVVVVVSAITGSVFVWIVIRSGYIVE